MLADRHRIALDLQDHVIQRRFAVVLGLQSTLRRVPPTEVEQRVAQAVEDVDRTVRDIRTAIFDLQDRSPGQPWTCAAR